MGKAMNKEVQINIIQYANNSLLWEEFRRTQLRTIAEYVENKKFIEFHLSNNLKKFIPNAEFHNSVPKCFPFKIENFNYQDPDMRFLIDFEFNYRKDDGFPNNKFKVEVKLNENKNKMTNKKEVKEFLMEVLFRLNYEIGYTRAYLNRIELDLDIILNNRERLKINESIMDVQKIFFDYVCKIVSEHSSLYPYLFPFHSYIFQTQESISSNEKFFKFIADVTDNNVEATAIKQCYIDHKNKKKIPELW